MSFQVLGSPRQPIKSLKVLNRRELARSHSTAELLPLVLSFYSTCAFPSNSLHPRWDPLIVARLLHIGHGTTIRQETLNELGLGIPRLAAVVHVVHRRLRKEKKLPARLQVALFHRRGTAEATLQKFDEARRKYNDTG